MLGKARWPRWFLGNAFALDGKFASSLFASEVKSEEAQEKDVVLSGFSHAHSTAPTIQTTGGAVKLRTRLAHCTHLIVHSHPRLHPGLAAVSTEVGCPQVSVLGCQLPSKHRAADLVLSTAWLGLVWAAPTNRVVLQISLVGGGLA